MLGFLYHIKVLCTIASLQAIADVSLFRFIVKETEPEIKVDITCLYYSCGYGNILFHAKSEEKNQKKLVFFSPRAHLISEMKHGCTKSSWYSNFGIIYIY